MLLAVVGAVRHEAANLLVAELRRVDFVGVRSDLLEQRVVVLAVVMVAVTGAIKSTHVTPLAEYGDLSVRARHRLVNPHALHAHATIDGTNRLMDP